MNEVPPTRARRGPRCTGPRGRPTERRRTRPNSHARIALSCARCTRTDRAQLSHAQGRGSRIRAVGRPPRSSGRTRPVMDPTSMVSPVAWRLTPSFLSCSSSAPSAPSADHSIAQPSPTAGVYSPHPHPPGKTFNLPLRLAHGLRDKYCAPGAGRYLH
jgi:hypothetical protein